MIKKRGVVAAVFCVSVLLTAAWNLTAPRIHEVSTLIEPPINAITDTGVQNFDSVLNIKAKIQSGIYNSKIIGELKLPDDELNFDISLPKDTRFIKISLRRTAAQTDAGKNILAKLLEALSLDYAEVMADKRARIENQIKLVLSQIGTKENEIRLKNEQFKILTEREKQYIDALTDAKANSEKLLASRAALFERKESKDDLSALLYTATIQQNISYFTQLQNDLADLKTKKENILNAVDNLKNSINESRIEIGNLNMSKNGVQNIRVIQEPYASSRPIGPQRKRNVLIAGVLGLFSGFFLALLMEYLENSPARS